MKILYVELAFRFWFTLINAKVFPSPNLLFGAKTKTSTNMNVKE